MAKQPDGRRVCHESRSNCGERCRCGSAGGVHNRDDGAGATDSCAFNVSHVITTGNPGPCPQHASGYTCSPEHWSDHRDYPAASAQRSASLGDAERD